MTIEHLPEHHRQHERYYRLGMHGGWTQGAVWTRRFIIILASVWVCSLIIPRLYPPMLGFITLLYMTPVNVVSGLIWQVFTAPWIGTICPCQLWLMPFHLLYLFVFGPKVEREWGNARFLRFYLIVAFLSTFIAFLLRLPTPYAEIPASATSAAIFAVMVAYGTMWPRDPFYVFGLFPSPVIYIILVLCSMEVLVMILLPATGLGVDYVASATGVVLGFAAMKIPAVKALFVGVKKKRIVTAGRRAKRQEYTPAGSASGGESAPAEASPTKLGKKKGKRSKYLEF